MMKKFMTFLISAVFGGMVVALSTPFFMKWEGTTPTQSQATSPQQQVVQATPVSNSTNNIVQSVDQVSKAVVGVTNIRSQMGQDTKTGSGSGVIYKKENGSSYVVTNNHVVENADKVEVVLYDGTNVPAEVLGSDPITDLAVLKMKDNQGTAVASLGTSDNLRPGEPVVAIGNPLGTEFSGSVTQGIISGVGRTIPIDYNQDGSVDWQTEVLQTDAAINPGNSGGPLINAKGEVIGINSMKIAQQQVEGIGFAIPISSAKPIINQLETTGKVQRPFIGIASTSLSEVPLAARQQTLNLPADVKDGIAITNIGSGSPAESAGLQKYDVIVKLDDQAITGLPDLRKYLYSKKNIGDQVNITFYRSGKKQTTTLTLGSQE